MPASRPRTLTHRQRLAVAAFETHRARQLAQPNISPVRLARLNYNGHGATAAAMAMLAGLSRETWRDAEAGRPVSPRTQRKIARALGRDVADLFPETRP